MIDVAIKILIGIGLTILLNIIIDYFILGEGSDLFTSINDIFKTKDRLFVHISSVIIQLALISVLGVNLVGGLYYLVTLIFYRITIIDYKTKYIDNKLFVLLLIVSFMSLAIDNGVGILESLATGVITFLLLWGFSKVTRGAFGIGDAKVLGALGIIFGLRGLLAILIAGGTLVFAVSIVLIIKSRSNAKKELPFTPYLFLGLLLVFIINNI